MNRSTGQKVFLEQFEDVLLDMAILKGGIQLIGPFVSAKNICEPILQNHKLCLFHLSLYIVLFFLTDHLLWNP